jgi:hypothetical protein
VNSGGVCMCVVTFYRQAGAGDADKNFELIL